MPKQKNHKREKIIADIKKGLAEIKEAKSNGKELQTLQSFLEESGVKTLR